MSYGSHSALASLVRPDLSGPSRNYGTLFIRIPTMGYNALSIVPFMRRDGLLCGLMWINVGLCGFVWVSWQAGVIVFREAPVSSGGTRLERAEWLP